VWGGGGNLYIVLVGKPEGRNHLEDPGKDGRIILKLVFEKWEREQGRDRQGPG
jgi:hypothetical protein